ncbi:MAG: hypothetical protein RLY31_2667 [Bacteroidota bacterium]|jgi:CubicO group peptidase (beta-lactamase class C family)
MKHFTWICLFLFYLAPAPAFPQTPASFPLEIPEGAIQTTDWLDASENTLLLRNRNDLLPLRNPAAVHIRLLYPGMPPNHTFRQTTIQFLPPDVILRSSKDWSDQLLILVLDATALRTATISPDSLLSLAAHFPSSSWKMALVLLGPADDWPALTASRLLERADALVWSPSADPANQSVSAQLIFGGCAAAPAAGHPPFQAGKSLPTPKGFRLGYAPPESVGIDGQRLADSIAAIVRSGIDAHAYPGAQVLVAKNGKIVYHETFGHHTYDSIRPVRRDDIYDFASVTKVTSTLPALMKLYGDNRLNLDAPLRRYLPMFRRSDKGSITLRQFLAHNGRLQPSIVFWREARLPSGEWKRKSFRPHPSRRYNIPITDSLFLFRRYRKTIYRGIRDQALRKEPGYVYSDLSFILYPAIVEKITRQPLEPYLKNTFYLPVGAYSLTYNPLRFFPKERIVPTELDTFFRKQPVHGTVHDETAAMLGGVSGHAGLFGSAPDLAKLIQLYLNHGQYAGKTIIPPHAVDQFTRCQYCDAGNRRGLGFDKPPLVYQPGEAYIAQDAPPGSYGHSGYTGTFFWADPDQQLILIFFSNRVYPDRSSTGLYRLNIRPRLHQAVYDAIRK